MRYTDDELLKLIGEERKRSIGFGEGDSGELTDAREKALLYYKGEMNDVPSLPGRSKAVDTSVADAIETVLPDVLEVFVGGEDVATFIPQGEQDEESAQEETDFVNHVVFTENEGFLTLYTGFKDALLTRTGIFYWYWQEEEKEETKAQVSAEFAPMAQAMAQMAGQELEPTEEEDGTISLKQTSLHGKVRIQAVPPEDFTVAPDTVSLKDATYCAMRDRPRVQDLIARGIEPEKARELKSYAARNEAIEQARDEAGESDTNGNDAMGDLRTVEIRAHFIRLDTNGNGKLEVWRVITDSEERVLLDKEQVDHIPFASVTPYMVPHRFYGESVADKLIQVQQIKTALLRMLLDSGYFALNQRMEVAMNKANEFTISDLLRNEPNVPVRTAQEGAIRPLSAGALNFDAMAALEYASTLAESRSGIVRNAQGLNPDTLHDTAKGAMALVAAAQKRVRLIARIFAETGVKDLFLGVHALLRKGHTEGHAPLNAKLRNNWKTVVPNEWPERCAMTIHVGVGSAGKEHDLIVSTQRLELMERVMMTAGESGIVSPAQIHNALTAWERAAGSKTPDSYWADPADPNTPKPEPRPDPEMAKAQAELQLKQQEGQAHLQMKAQEGQMKAQLDAQSDSRAHEREVMKLQTEGEIRRWQIEQELQLKRETTAAELQMKRELLLAELEMKRETAYLNADVARETGLAKVQASSDVSDVKTGGEPG